MRRFSTLFLIGSMALAAAGCAEAPSGEAPPGEAPATDSLDAGGAAGVTAEPIDPTYDNPDAAPPKAPHPIELRLEECQEEENWTTQGVLVCMGEAIDAWDAEMNAIYAELMTLVDGETEASIRETQRAWMAFRDAELEVVRSTWSMEMGTSGRWTMAGYHMDLVKRRVRDLEWMRDAFRRRADIAEAEG